jgi:hypothetical protein
MKIKVLNKYLALVTYGNGSPRMEANPFELTKQSVLYEQKSKNLPLPRFGLDNYRFEDDYPDLILWWQNSNILPPEIIEGLDFSKPYDSELINKYKNERKSIKKIEINADDLIDAELNAE